MVHITIDSVELTDDIGNKFVGSVTFDMTELRQALRKAGYKLVKEE